MVIETMMKNSDCSTMQQRNKATTQQCKNTTMKKHNKATSNNVTRHRCSMPTTGQNEAEKTNTGGQS